MSVLINMEMPESCFDCPFMYGRRYCRANSKIEFNDPDYSELKGRYDGCPLVPATNVRPVAKAKWEWNDNNGYYYCGNCKAVSPREDQDGEYIDCPNFCPNCGADMREES